MKASPYAGLWLDSWAPAGGEQKEKVPPPFFQIAQSVIQSFCRILRKVVSNGGPFLRAREMIAFLIFTSLATNCIAYFVPFFDGGYIVGNS